jgi:hypothetical protein
MADGATMPAFSDGRLIDAAGAVVADQSEQRPLLVVAVASGLEVVVDAPPYPSHGAFCRSRAADREHQAVPDLAQARISHIGLTLIPPYACSIAFSGDRNYLPRPACGERVGVRGDFSSSDRSLWRTPSRFSMTSLFQTRITR